MKSMLKQTIYVILFLLIGMNTLAQKTMPKHIQKIHDRTEEMAIIMDLTEDQKAKILEIKMATEAERITKILKKYEIGTEEYIKAIKELYRNNSLKMKAEVSVEQWKKWQQRPNKG
ncbi:hypothetical protein [Saccharicrinis aurantiacus]|uniref:hypothetical protein n=1 Tax=Saccharicrinis aurantiacus TaxID=1849719 RepID=UPI0008384E38|nr:hypothetical protein [Saccharicrinis aurantiacus]